MKKTLKYKGKCDVIRTESFKWQEFKENDLIIDKKYEILGTWLAQSTWIKKDNEFIQDHSGARYRYYLVMNENHEQTYVWDGFFDGDIL